MTVHVVPAYDSPVTVHLVPLRSALARESLDAGSPEILVFNTLAAVARHFTRRQLRYCVTAWRDGEVVPLVKLMSLKQPRKPVGAPALGLPVRGTGRRSGGRYFRSLSHLGVRRQACCVLEEGEPPPRGARSLANLPDSWDDWMRTSVRHRSWKQFRKTQWR